MFASPTSLAGRAIPTRKFIVDGWLPAGVVTLNFGDGGVGKTLLTQQLMTATALGRNWCGMAVHPCRSVALFCEDDDDELHRRQEAINRSYGCNYEDLSNMVWTSGVGQDNTLVEFDMDGRMHLTPAFHSLQKQAVEIKAELVVIDTAADTFGGFENDRRQVRQFLSTALGTLARDIGGAVLMNTHPSRSGMSKAGDMDGGSTAWSNTARSRWSLSRPEIAEGEHEDRDARVLRKRKSNYGSTGDEIKLRWEAGVLVPKDRPSGFAAMSTEGNADAAFLSLLARLTQENRPVSDNIRAGNYAPKMFSACPDRQGFTTRDFKCAMERLFEAKLISMQAYGRASDLRHRIAAVDAV